MKDLRHIASASIEMAARSKYGRASWEDPSHRRDRLTEKAKVRPARGDYYRGTKTPDEITEYYLRGGEQTRFHNAQGQLEALRTQELLARFLPPPPADILDVGGGPGYYARWLATRGYRVTLIDPIPLHVEQAHEAARREGPEIIARLGDARRLEFPDRSMDAVLEFGPLYHLPAQEDRVRALSEAGRVTKPGGPILVALISRFASLLDGLRLGFIDRPGALAAIAADLRTGEHRNPDRHPAMFTTAYFHHPDEIANDFESAGVTLDQLIAIEGPAWLFSDLQARLDDPDRRNRLLEAVRLVEAEPRMVGVSAHLMAIGRSQEL